MPITLNGDSGIIGAINSATAQNSTSGTAINFTGIPSGVKRITVMFNGVSTSSGTANVWIQIGSGSVDTSGYAAGSYYGQSSASNGMASSTSAFLIYWNGAAALRTGAMRLHLLNASTNLWVADHTFYVSDGTPGCVFGGGNKTLSGTLDRVRVTTANGTDTFDAGSINILYE